MRKPTGYGTTLALAQADFPQMIDAIRRNAGNPRIKVAAMPWRMMRRLSPFVPLFRELAEMRYL